MKMMDNDMHDVEPVHIFLQDSGGTVKSYLTKVIYNVTSKALLYLCKDHDKPQVTHSRKKNKNKKKIANVSAKQNQTICKWNDKTHRSQ